MNSPVLIGCGIQYKPMPRGGRREDERRADRDRGDRRRNKDRGGGRASTKSSKGKGSTNPLSSSSLANAAKSAASQVLGSNGIANIFGGGNPSAWQDLAFALPDMLMGMGKYHVKKNSLAHAKHRHHQGLGGSTAAIARGVPYMHDSCSKTRISHREYLCDVITSGTANVFSTMTSYPLNPGIATTFPWLAAVAAQFQEYTFHGLAFEFVSTSADAIASSTNTALGTVMMGTRYNPGFPAFLSKAEMLNEEYSTDCKPSESMVHLIECDPKENPYNIQYIRSTNNYSGSLQNYDLGTMYVATSGFQGTNVVIGELWVTYDVELRKPIPANLAGYSNSYFFSIGTASIGTSHYFGSDATPSFNNWFGGTISLGATTITITSDYVGPFGIFYAVTGGSPASTVAPTVTATTNLSQLGLFGPSTYSVSSTGNDIGSFWWCGTFQYSASAANSQQAVVTFSSGTLPTSCTDAYLLVFPLAQVE
jgi:hypothetical protein